MGCLRWVLKAALVCLLILAGALALGGAVADWLNFPLLPFDLLNPMGIVDVRIELPDLDADVASRLLIAEGGVSVRVLDEQGRPLEELVPRRTDTSGRAKLNLPRGSYRLAARLTGLVEGALEGFATPGEGVTIQVADELQEVAVPLHRLDAADPAGLQARILAALESGDLGLARDLALQLGDLRAPGAEPEAPLPLAGPVVEAVDEIQAIRLEIDALPLDAYNSRIRAFHRCLGLLLTLLPEGQPREDVRLGTHQDQVYPISRVAALRRGRDRVIADHLHSFHAFREHRRLRSVATGYLQWLRIVDDADLYDLEEVYDQELMAELEAAREAAGTDEAWLLERLPRVMEEARQAYDQGEMEASSELVALYLRLATPLEAGLELDPEDLEAARSLRRDIRMVEAGDQLFGLGRFGDAQDRYREVVSPCPRVVLRLEELEYLTRRARASEEEIR